ncbi:protein transport protein Sec31A-like [Corticium candelabrum]|uniref:protein transport protein Sec31A-like n=1 Tax=Corticium candelabrum TaxID=121492 RepID=UPI002E265B36|nr:protein transport protein Sec31A-like [Corticium candelabrum]
MKVKEIHRTANIAFSPAKHHPILLAAGTAAQQLDATFSTTAALEIFALDLAESGLEMPLKASIAVQQRFHKLVWAAYGLSGADRANGLLIGGSDNGTVYHWDCAEIMKGKEGLVFKSDMHSGAVRAMDINPFQSNLLATGASESEIFIWDLNNPESPMSPGAKIQPPEDVSCVAWNCQVQHILASTSPSGRSVVWDLRKNEPIIQVSDHSSRIRCKVIAWHPDVATQMATASEDDRSPVVQLWDLRFATSPMKVLEHQRGILSMAWCPRDSDLLLTCGKDNRVLCWNPNSTAQGGEIVYELPTTSQWSFDIHWCPRNPSAIATASFDGHVSVFSLMGGHTATDKATTVASDDPFASSILAQQQPTTMLLKTPPKWFRRPCGASFGFGGKLVSFGQYEGPKQVHISQVVTEFELLQQSRNLEAALRCNTVVDFCQEKIESSESDRDCQIWNFLKVCFSKEPRQNFLTLLGYTTEELEKKVGALVGQGLAQTTGVDTTTLAEKMENLETKDDAAQEAQAQASLAFEGTTLTESDPSPFDDLNESASHVDQTLAATGGKRPGQLLLTTQISSHVAAPFLISTDDNVDGVLSKALLMGNFEMAVEICLHGDRMADALLLAVAGGSELFARTQQIYFQKRKSQVSRLVSAVVQRDWLDIVQYGELENWKEMLAALLTYARPEEFPTLCDVLGSRLETDDKGLREKALLCYICAGNVNKLVDCWAEISEKPDFPMAIQDLIEKAMVLTRAVETERKQAPSTTSTILSHKLQQYAVLLASQGSLDTAYGYLERAVTAQDAQMEWRDRVYRAQAVSNQRAPEFPFDVINVLPEQAPVVHAAIRGDEISRQPKSIDSQFGGQTSFAGHSVPKQHAYQQPLYSGGPKDYSRTAGSSGFLQQHPVATYPPGSIHAVSPRPPSVSDSSSFSSTQLVPPSGPPTGATQLVPSMQHPSVRPPIAKTERVQEPVPPGWHDPPPLKPGTSTPTAYVAPAPITAPIAGMPAPTHEPMQAAGQWHLPHQPPQNLQRTNQEHLSSPPARVKKEPTPPPSKLKEPIPAEHMALVETFDGLLDRCRRVAQNPAMKRKADEVKKRLDFLYDKLRDKTLTPTTLGSIHQMCQVIQAGDYQSALGIHQGLVASSSFNETSGFLPGLKTLLQMSLQLRV